jgi:hypothetical protein
MHAQYLDPWKHEPVCKLRYGEGFFEARISVMPLRATDSVHTLRRKGMPHKQISFEHR